jgi:hypothetical protein
MAILVDRNGLPYLVSDSVIEEPSASGQIFDNIKSLAISLNSETNITRSNLGNVQSTIQSSNSTFNVFAVVSHLRNAESFVGLTATGGRRTFTQENFVANASNSFLSTGKTIVDMSGGINYSIPEIDGKKWMGMAVYDGTANGFRGIMLWVFTNELITTTNSVISGTGTVTNAASIFNPTLFTSTSNYRRIYQVIINRDGGISASNVSGEAGWLYSTSQASTRFGYNTLSRFASDDGIWAFVIGGKVNGDTPGPSYKTTNGYGLGNFNSSDSSSNLYWGGSNISSTNYVGFVFTGDA